MNGFGIRFNQWVGAAFATIVCLSAAPVSAQWNPANAQWGKSVATDLRVMTWNVQDGICSSNNKVEGSNDWSALAHIVASMQPDILILQETADNAGEGTGSGVDSVTNLTTTLNLFLHGGNDPFHGNIPVTSYVQLFAPAYDLPFIFVSTDHDGFNRNVILSRYAFTDLNGDGLSQRSDIPVVSAHLYSPGGDGGIRGFMFAEIDLPGANYIGNVVIGCAHLKSGGSADDLAQRLLASKNVAYVIDFWYNGGGLGVPDPHSKIADAPAATSILAAATPVIIGGDWNEDEQTNGRKGPAEWLTRAEFTAGTDGTDRDRTDAVFDSATHVFTGSRITQGGSKLDYLAWQDSIVTLRRAFVFNTSGTPGSALPPQLTGYPTPGSASSVASDHRPVIADLIVPVTGGLPSGACCDGLVCMNNQTLGDCQAIEGVYHGDGTNCAGVTCMLPTGGCCVGGVCSDGITRPDCQTAIGVYQGDDSDCAGVACLTPPAVTINEIRVDQAGSDADEYFELTGPPGTSLDTMAYIVLGEGAGGSGVIETVIDLNGRVIPSDGYFLAAETSFDLGGGQSVVDMSLGATGLNFESDDNITHMIVQEFSGMDGQDLDEDDDGVLDVTPWTNIVDRIALIKSNNPPAGTEYHYGPPTIGPSGPTNPAYIYRETDGSGPWQIGVVDPVGTDDTPGAANNPPPVPTLSQWGVIVVCELVLVAGTILSTRRRRPEF